MLERIVSVILALAPLIAAPAASGQDAPHIAYSDLTSGPASGGQGNQGTIVTIFGSGFGRSQDASQVLLAGALVHPVIEWTDKRIAFQIGSTARSGLITVHTSLGDSNGAVFAVTRGRIYFVAPTGNDSGPGTWTNPWRTIPRAASAMRPGDITYVLNGVRQAAIDNYNASLSIQTTGKSQLPIAIVAYPGANVVLGDADGPEFGLRTPSIRSGPFNDWVIAGFTIRGANTALRLDAISRWRVVNNDFSCPHGDGSSACVEISSSSWIVFLGNTVHHAGKPGASKHYQTVYFTTDTNHVDVGWNHNLRNNSCRGIQFHSSPLSLGSGFGQFDLAIHDNTISDQACDGINLATIDPSKGRIAVFRNTISNVGTGPAPPDGEASYTCISSPGIVNRGAPGTGSVEVYDNTLSDCGTFGGPSAAAFHIGPNSPDLILTNNFVKQHGQPYFTSGSTLTKVHCISTLWTGSGPGPHEMNVTK